MARATPRGGRSYWCLPRRRGPDPYRLHLGPPSRPCPHRRRSDRNAAVTEAERAAAKQGAEVRATVKTAVERVRRWPRWAQWCLVAGLLAVASGALTVVVLRPLAEAPAEQAADLRGRIARASPTELPRLTLEKDLLQYEQARTDHWIKLGTGTV